LGEKDDNDVMDDDDELDANDELRFLLVVGPVFFFFVITFDAT